MTDKVGAEEEVMDEATVDGIISSFLDALALEPSTPTKPKKEWKPSTPSTATSTPLRPLVVESDVLPLPAIPDWPKEQVAVFGYGEKKLNNKVSWVSKEPGSKASWAELEGALDTFDIQPTFEHECVESVGGDIEEQPKYMNGALESLGLSNISPAVGATTGVVEPSTHWVESHDLSHSASLVGKQSHIPLSPNLHPYHVENDVKKGGEESPKPLHVETPDDECAMPDKSLVDFSMAEGVKDTSVDEGAAQKDDTVDTGVSGQHKSSGLECKANVLNAVAAEGKHDVDTRSEKPLVDKSGSDPKEAGNSINHNFATTSQQVLQKKQCCMGVVQKEGESPHKHAVGEFWEEETCLLITCVCFVLDVSLPFAPRSVNPVLSFCSCENQVHDCTFELSFAYMLSAALQCDGELPWPMVWDGLMGAGLEDELKDAGQHVVPNVANIEEMCGDLDRWSEAEATSHLDMPVEVSKGQNKTRKQRRAAAYKQKQFDASPHCAPKLQDGEENTLQFVHPNPFAALADMDVMTEEVLEQSGASPPKYVALFQLAPSRRKLLCNMVGHTLVKEMTKQVHTSKVIEDEATAVQVVVDILAPLEPFLSTPSFRAAAVVLQEIAFYRLAEHIWAKEGTACDHQSGL